ncbi:MAG: YwiC-like family protein [Nitriliruptoraceae bacterium]
MSDRSSAPRRSRGWYPEQHGAWAMLILPALAGAWLSGPRWPQLALGAFWLLGYLAYHAAGRWLRAHRRPRDRAPVLVYGSLAAALGLLTLTLAPHLLRWVPVYLPLLGISLWLTAGGRERSLINDVVTVVAACLMAAVTFDAGDGERWLSLWVVTGVLVAYFLGTVLYVKTMIRERGRRAFRLASIAYHLVVTVAAGGAVLRGWQSWWLVVIAGVLTVRAALGPAINARRAQPIRPVVVGVGEIVASVAVTAAALTGLPGG